MNRHLLIAAVTGIIAVISETLFHDTTGSALLIALLFWTAIGQGIMALAAAAYLSQGSWIAPIRDRLLDLWPYLLMPPIALVGHLFHLSDYPWYHHPTAYLQPGSAMGRNGLLLTLTLLAAFIFVQAVKGEKKRAPLWACIYLFLFVISQSFMAVDFVMSLEYPWISTLFPPFFFVEAVFLGVGMCAILASVLYLRYGEPYRSVMRDFSTLTLGFSLFWGGLFYAQFLTIWYGNLPEEVSFIAKRMHDPAFYKIGALAVIMMWAIPFTSFITKKAKVTPLLIRILVASVFAGYLLEKIFYIQPVIKANPIFLLGYGILFAVPFILLAKDGVRS
ncbi:MAG TPA: hypothetical protein PK014_09780 [Thermoanaerobaculia bacterium]|nr:hypothetical protein [Thermoanaerobaculia bacterium]HUM30113.1 hypothetical protein [Thermoanaerobaculia bacterium]HXK68810.1 hypothetical protein [Thermoanaerobaculia bacterium]